MVVDAEYLENLSTDVELPEAQPDLPSVVAPQTIVNALGTLPFPLLLKDAGFRYVYANKSAAKVIGRSPEEIVGGTAADFFPADDAARFEEIERAVLASGKRVEIEQRLLNADSREAQIRVRFDRVEDAQGNHLVRSIVTDVTEVDNKLNDQIRRVTLLENSVAHMAQGLVVLRGERVEFASPRVLALLETLDDVIAPGVKWLDVLEYSFRRGDCGSDEAAIAKGMAHVNAFNERKAFRYKRRMPSGAILVFEGEPLATSDGLIITISDITEDRIKDSGLRNAMRENEVFRTMIDNIPLSIYAKTEDLKLTYVNEAWEHLVGIKAEHAIGKTDVDLMGADGLVFADDDREVLAGEVTVTFNETATNGEGEITHRIAKKRPFMTADGTRYLIGSTTDITDIRNRETELEAATLRAAAADRAKSEFLANMSHEIRTPMNGVMGMAELLAKTGLDPKQKTFVDIIVKSGASLLTIINDILDFSKIDAGQLELDPQPFRLAEAIEDVATLVSSKVAEKDLELAVRIDPALPEMLVGDVGRIRQIVTNLLGNAVKFTEHGHIVVDVSMVGGAPAQTGEPAKLRFSVEDTGIGIPADKLERIFEKFSQVDTSATRRHEGTGLGLAIASSLVALMGGQMQVESQVGRGSTFHFEIELPMHGASEKRKRIPVDVTGSKILVVDDNAVNRAILMEQMAAWRFDAATCSSGAEALALVEAAAKNGVKIDLAILDYHMPEMNGAQLAGHLRANPVTAGLPIVMLTSVDQTEDGRTFSSLGVQAHLTKPARSSLLLETMIDVLQVNRARSHREPVAAAEMPSMLSTVEAAVSDEAFAPATSEQIDILVAEDNEVNQIVFSQILEMTGYRYEIAVDGEQAVEKFKALRPRVILMDVSMPKMNGLEATAAIRGLERGSGFHTPIIGVTAHAIKGDIERCMTAGMDDYLSKPVSPDQLIMAINQWMDDVTAQRIA